MNQHKAQDTSLFAVGTTGLAGALGYGIRASNDSDRDSNGDGKGGSSVVSANGVGNCIDGADGAPMAMGSPQRSRTTAIPREEGRVKHNAALAIVLSAAISVQLGAFASSRLFG